MEAICAGIADRVRRGRSEMKYSQHGFAELCGVPLRTYKRFELGQCDSLNVFIRIVVAFDRVAALNLLFPPQRTEINTVSAPAALARLRRRLEK